jgi:AcrR family transcriptional regulator
VALSGLPRPRRAQARSIETRRRLLDAAVACLIEHGYARTTTEAVARAAGVTRGALLHHFPTRDHLLTQLLAHLDVLHARELRRRFATLARSSDPAGEAVDALAALYAGGPAAARVELAAAARADAGLREKLVPYLGRRSVLPESVTRAGFGAAHAHPQLAAALRTVVEALEGAALARPFGGADAGADERLEMLRGLLRRAHAAASASLPAPPGAG